MKTARNIEIETALARGNVYGFLANVFRAEPSEALIDEMKKSEFIEILSRLGHSLGVEFSQTPSGHLVEDLAVEFTKLFIGPGPHISPHESIFAEVNGCETGLWGEKTVAVKKFIESAGYEYEANFSGLPDHISVELEFMQKLAETEARLRSDKEMERADWCRNVQEKFIDEHLGQWAPKLCDAIISKAQMPFYVQMAELTNSVIEFDCQPQSSQLSECA